MDNHFVPNLTLGLPVVQAIQKVSPVPLDCHLMIEVPERWAPGYAEAGARNGTVHAEACTGDPRAVARDLRAAGSLAGLALKPGTPIEDYLDVLREFDTLLVMTVEPGFGGQEFMADVLPKVRTARDLVQTGHLTLFIEVDGGINAGAIAQAAAAGADVFVAGSAVYGADAPAEAVAARRAEGGADRLRGAGVDVALPVEQDEAEDGALASWLTGVREHRPRGVWKVGATLDVRVAAADGTS